MQGRCGSRAVELGVDLLVDEADRRQPVEEVATLEPVALPPGAATEVTQAPLGAVLMRVERVGVAPTVCSTDSAVKRGRSGGWLLCGPG